MVTVASSDDEKEIVIKTTADETDNSKNVLHASTAVMKYVEGYGENGKQKTYNILLLRDNGACGNIKPTTDCTTESCGGEERGECRMMPWSDIMLCFCKMDYKGEHCEEALKVTINVPNHGSYDKIVFAEFEKPHSDFAQLV